MKVLVAASACWIAISLFDKALFDGRLISGLPSMARAVAAGLGYYF